MQVERISLTPVCGTHLTHVDELRLDHRGAALDRRFYFVDDDGRLMDSVRRGVLNSIRSEWDGRVLALQLPDGTRVQGVPEARAGDEAYLAAGDGGRRVPGRVIDGPFAAAVEELAGRHVRLVQVMGESSAQACFPVSIIGSASVAALLPPQFSSARFRMLIEFSGGRPYEEDEWIGRRVRVGEVGLALRESVRRCVLTTRDPDTGERDVDTLRELIATRGDVLIGVYADVEEPGTIRLGDIVEPVSG